MDGFDQYKFSMNKIFFKLAILLFTIFLLVLCTDYHCNAMLLFFTL